MNQYASRVATQNENANQSLNEETLLNILRARDYKPVNFLAISQLSAGGSESVSIGLPTITFGPHQVPTSRQYVFGNNGISSSSGMTFQTNPLITSDFVKGQSAPIPSSNLALLLANFPREIVYYATIDRVRIIFSGYSLNITNNPSDNHSIDGRDCSEHEADLIDSSFYSKTNEAYCNFSKFKHIINALIDHGVTAELIPIATKTSKEDSDSDKDQSPKFAGQFCHDQSLDTKKSDKSNALKACGSGKLFSDNQALSISKAGHKTEILFRSPAKIYRYVGSVSTSSVPLIIDYKDKDAEAFRGERFINIIKSDGPECDVSVIYGSERWCVPGTGSKSTFVVFNMLQNLRNLSISSDETNKGILLSSVN